jgi:hypothetical protein
MIHVFAIEIVDQREHLGAKLLVTRNTDYGIAVAAAMHETSPTTTLAQCLAGTKGTITLLLPKMFAARCY